MTLHIAWRELRNLFLSPLAWSVLAVMQLLLAFLLLAQLENFQAIQGRLLGIDGAPGVTDLVATPVLSSATTLLLLVVPLLSMRLFADERRTGTLRLLMSSPVSIHHIVLGKYLGLVGLLLVMVGMILLMPASLALGTTLDWGKLGAAALGLALMVSAFAAAGLFMSTLTTQPVVAAISTFGLLLMLWIIDWAGTVEQRLSGVFGYVSMLRHYESMLRGTFNSADAVYYLLFIVLFLGLAVRRLEAERLQR